MPFLLISVSCALFACPCEQEREEEVEVLQERLAALLADEKRTAEEADMVLPFLTNLPTLLASLIRSVSFGCLVVVYVREL